MNKLSVTIIALNEEERIRVALESVRWADEIIVVDSGSTDNTLGICKEYPNCKTFVQPFLGYGMQKRLAVEKASNDWILSLDADEVVTEGLQKEIISVLSSENITTAGYLVPITLIFMQKVFKYGCEHKQRHLRFFNRNRGNFNTLKIHEGVILDGAIGKLRNEILHNSFIDIHEYFQKFNDYTTICRDESLKKGKHFSKTKNIIRFPFEFIKQYFIRLNFLNGYPGFVWSLFSALYIFVKHAKLYESSLKAKP
ncbi:MAG: glycosyltransferase family 2 protein [Bacteroidales bacterium]|nr:glycosyltransferase family 2 protein [Bacteroidales bacterium]